MEKEGYRMANVIVIAVIAILLVLSIRYILKEKKNGRDCIGCPNSSTCSKRKKCQGK